MNYSRPDWSWSGYGYDPYVLYAPGLPPMVGSQMAAPTVAAPRVFTTATAEGRARTCIRGEEFRYRRGERLQVLASQRTREGVFYLVLSPAGCAGWVQARDLGVARRCEAGRPAEEYGIIDVDMGDLGGVLPGAEGVDPVA